MQGSSSFSAPPPISLRLPSTRTKAPKLELRAQIKTYRETCEFVKQLSRSWWLWKESGFWWEEGKSTSGSRASV